MLHKGNNQQFQTDCANKLEKVDYWPGKTEHIPEHSYSNLLLPSAMTEALQAIYRRVSCPFFPPLT